MLFSRCRVTVRTSMRAHMFYIVNVSFLRIVYRVQKKITFSAFACQSHCLVIRVTLARRMCVQRLNVIRTYVSCDACTLDFKKGLRCLIIVLFFANSKWQRVGIFNSLFFYRLHPLRVGIKKKGKISCTGGFRIRVKFSDRSVGKRWKWKTVFRWHCSFLGKRVREISVGKCGPLMAVKRTTTKGPPQKGRCPQWIHLCRPVYSI